MTIRRLEGDTDMESVLELTERPLLATLREINRCADSPQEAASVLTNIACAIGNRLKCDACSIYRLNRQQQTLILAGTVGLRQDCIEKLSMKQGEGLTGLVAEVRRPIEIAAQASAHPRFKYFPEAGEEPYESFLGAPIINGQTLEGVLVVQTIEPHAFTPTEVSMLAIAGRDLGKIVARLVDRESPS